MVSVTDYLNGHVCVFVVVVVVVFLLLLFNRFAHTAGPGKRNGWVDASMGRWVGGSMCPKGNHTRNTATAMGAQQIPKWTPNEPQRVTLTPQGNNF